MSMETKNSNINQGPLLTWKFVIVLTDMLSIYQCIYKILSKIQQLVHNFLCINEISTSIKDHNSVENERKTLFNHPNLHLVNINVYTKFDQKSTN